MATSTESSTDHMTAGDITETMNSIKMMIKVSVVIALVGYVLILFSLSQEFTTVAAIFAEDSMKMWLKLGGVGHILIGIFISLVAIIRTLSLVPHRLGQQLQ